MRRDMNITEGEKLVRLGLNIAYYRRLKSLTQEELAVKSKISRAQLSHIEAPNEYVNPTVLTLIRISDALGVPLHILVELRKDA